MTENVKRLSTVDLAHDVLHSEGRAMYFRDLITKVLERKKDPIHFLAHAMAEVHTQINLDSRFMYMGKGMWGLNEWMPQKGNRTSEEVTVASSEVDVRREKLLEEIQQQDFVAAADEADERD